MVAKSKRIPPVFTHASQIPSSFDAIQCQTSVGFTRRTSGSGTGVSCGIVGVDGRGDVKDFVVKMGRYISRRVGRG
jgi:hypothetical protein